MSGKSHYLSCAGLVLHTGQRGDAGVAKAVLFFWGGTPQKFHILVDTKTRWLFQISFYFHPYLGKIPNLTNMFKWVETTNQLKFKGTRWSVCYLFRALVVKTWTGTQVAGMFLVAEVVCACELMNPLAYKHEAYSENRQLLGRIKNNANKKHGSQIMTRCGFNH